MNNETIWEANSLEPKVVQILRDLKYDGHHLGRPFATGYQLAILFKETFREDFDRLGYPVGGKGIGHEFTLASYLARELSQRIKRCEITNVEGGFLSNQRLRKIEFNDAGESVVSSLTGGEDDVAIFRYIEDSGDRGN